MTQPSDVVTKVDQLTFTGVVVQEFKAKLDDYEFPVENNQPKTKIQFVDLEVIKTKQDYPFPVLELVMNRANAKGEVSDRGPWGMYIISSDSQGYPDVMELKGKTLHMLSTQQEIPADPKRNQTAGSFTTWEILSVDGKDDRPTKSEASADNDSEED